MNFFTTNFAKRQQENIVLAKRTAYALDLHISALDTIAIIKKTNLLRFLLVCIHNNDNLFSVFIKRKKRKSRDSGFAFAISLIVIVQTQLSKEKFKNF